MNQRFDDAQPNQHDQRSRQIDTGHWVFVLYAEVGQPEADLVKMVVEPASRPKLKPKTYQVN